MSCLNVESANLVPNRVEILVDVLSFVKLLSHFEHDVRVRLASHVHGHHFSAFDYVYFKDSIVANTVLVESFSPFRLDQSVFKAVSSLLVLRNVLFKLL